MWTRLIMPNGRSIVLERQQGADAGGYSGLEDEVDNHWKELLGAAALSTLLGVGSELGPGADKRRCRTSRVKVFSIKSQERHDVPNPDVAEGRKLGWFLMLYLQLPFAKPDPEPN